MQARTTCGSYLRDLSRCPFLSAEEERELILRWKEGGDARAREKLIEGNLKHVAKLTWKMRCYNMPLEELAAEGCLGLMEGVDKFDPGRGVKLVTYASWWIRAHMMRAVINHYRKGRSGALNKHFWHIRRASRLPVDSEMAQVRELQEKAGLKEEDAIWALAAIRGDGPADYLPAGGANAEEQVAHDERVRMVLEAMDRTLSVREMRVVVSMFMGRDKVTLQDLGNEHGVTRERIRQNKARALKKIRRWLKVA